MASRSIRRILGGGNLAVPCWTHKRDRATDGNKGMAISV